MLGKHCPKLPWPCIITACMSYLTMEGLNKEHETNKLLPVRRIWEGTKGGRGCQPIICSANLPETLVLETTLINRYVHFQEGSWIILQGQNDWPEATQKENPITIKPKTASLMTAQSLEFPYSPALHLAPIPNIFFCFVSMCSSLDNSFEW